MSSKTFVLDTNILLHNPNALYSFDDNKVVIPIFVIEELDRFKKSPDEKGRNARWIAREIDQLRGKGILREGAALSNGGKLQILLDFEVDPPKNLSPTVTDNNILLAALSLKQKGEHVIFISKDLNARIKADVLRLETQDFELQKVDLDELYSGYCEIEVTANQLHEFETYNSMKLGGDFVDNEYIQLIDKQQRDHVELARFDEDSNSLLFIDKESLIPLKESSEDIKPTEKEIQRSRNLWGITPRNIPQRFACDALMNPDIKLVTLVGQAGTGKTLLALAAALEQVVEQKQYKKITVSRPIMPMGKDIGYLPGDKDEKLFYWMQPIYDNLRFMMSAKHSDLSPKDQDKHVQMFFEQQFIDLEALTYIRGRSIPKQYLIIDEAQNLTPHEIKTIISRAGEGTKIVLTGDPYQIDNPYLDSNSNGLCYVVDRFKGQSIYAHILFTKSERSELASLAADLL